MHVHNAIADSANASGRTRGWRDVERLPPLFCARWRAQNRGGTLAFRMQEDRAMSRGGGAFLRGWLLAHDDGFAAVGDQFRRLAHRIIFGVDVAHEHRNGFVRG